MIDHRRWVVSQAADGSYQYEYVGPGQRDPDKVVARFYSHGDAQKEARVLNARRRAEVERSLELDFGPVPEEEVLR